MPKWQYKRLVLFSELARLIFSFSLQAKKKQSYNDFAKGKEKNKTLLKANSQITVA